MKKFLFAIKMALIASLVVGLFTVSGCNEKYDPKAFHIYYINEDTNGLVPMEYELKNTDVTLQIRELIEVLSKDTGRVDHIKPIKDGLKITKYELTDGYLSLDFNSYYNELDNVTEVLCRSALVKTFMQIDGINGVWFYVEGEQIVNDKGDYVGLMTADTFIDNPGEEMQNIQETELALYFASTDGKGLVKVVREVHYSSNVSMEKLIVEQLLKEVQSDNFQAAIPKGTKLINVSVLDGVCVVNFDGSFMTQNYDISEEVVIYSIVNSLTELSTIEKVQIAVDGVTNIVYREKYSLTEQYLRNLSLVIEENDIVEVVDEASEKGGVLNNITE